VKPRPLELVTARAPFRDRADAGRVLARSLARYRRTPDLVVLGLARGGVPVARAVADALDAPLSVIVARKVGVPGIEDVALAAIAEGSHYVLADTVAWYLGVPPRVVEKLATRERAELERRVNVYRAASPAPDLHGRTVVLVDDGLATGASIRAAIASIRARQAARIIAAVPVASRSSAEEVRQEVDELVTVVTPARFDTVSSAYDDYTPLSDDDVLTHLGLSRRRAVPNVRDIGDRLGRALSRPTSQPPDREERTIAIPAFDTTVVADLGLPRPTLTSKRVGHLHGVHGLAILAHGGGSSRNSYRNRYIAGRLRLSGYATLRLDLLTNDEQHADDAHAAIRFDVNRLATRLACVCEWAEREGVPGAHRTALIGADTGAAAALVTSARRPGRIFAVVARAGRVDLAADVLPAVRNPVLMIVGAADHESLSRNTIALDQLPRGAVLLRVSRAGRSFEEPGALGALAEHLVSWLERLESRQRRGSQWHA
jgi:putative phosphoribosyl transferase